MRKESNPAATAVNNAINHDRGPVADYEGDCDVPSLAARPDYTSGYSIVVEPPGKIASADPLYVSSITWNDKNHSRVEKFAFSADRLRAAVLHKLTAAEVARQLNGPDFKVTAHVILAADYEKMFKAVETLQPRSVPQIKSEIEWAKKYLKKQDRIVWYLRWYRLALTQRLYEYAVDKKHPVQAAAAPAPAPAVAPAQTPAQAQPLSERDQLQQLYEKYSRELVAKNPDWSNVGITLEAFPDVKEELMHFYSLPLPGIQNKVLGFETWRQIKKDFQAVEAEWQENSTRTVAPKPEDKIWMQFQDGWAWWWLPRPSCPDEAKAMGHCGNSPEAGSKGISILSLREPMKYGKETRWTPHLTFILHGKGDTGVLGEMKGRNNNKPVPRYFPYIVSLLKDPRITDIMGGGYAPERNFNIEDLDKEQRLEIAKSNPSVGLTIPDHYEEFGLDEGLLNKIRNLLSLGDDAEFRHGNLVVRKWKDYTEFVEDCGSGSEAGYAWVYSQTGVMSNFLFDDDNMLELFRYLSPEAIYHMGLALQYNFPREMKDWYRDENGNPRFDPKNPEYVKQAILDLYKERISGSDKEQQDKFNATPVLREFYRAYMSSLPSEESVEELVYEQVDRAMEDADGTTLEGNREGEILQVLDEDNAIELATDVERQNRNSRHPNRHPIDKPSIYINSDWDDWDEEEAGGNLSVYFENPPARPENKKQKRLFKEPKTQEEAKRRGITVSKLLKNALFKNPDYDSEEDEQTVLNAIQKSIPKKRTTPRAPVDRCAGSYTRLNLTQAEANRGWMPCPECKKPVKVRIHHTGESWPEATIPAHTKK